VLPPREEDGRERSTFSWEAEFVAPVKAELGRLQQRVVLGWGDFRALVSREGGT
jgi:hypothetical protein